MGKRVCTLLSALMCLALSSVFAQVKPYLAIVKTDKDTFKGVLYEASADSICLKTEKNTVYIASASVKSINLKEIRKNSKYRKFLNYDPYNDRFVKVSNKMVPVRKWGEKDPTIEEELSGRIVTCVYNTALNSVTSTVSSIFNGSVRYIEIDYSPSKYKSELTALNIHALRYQAEPENSALSIIASKEN